MTFYKRHRPSVLMQHQWPASMPWKSLLDPYYLVLRGPIKTFLCIIDTF